jgi:hypothetical protein
VAVEAAVGREEVVRARAAAARAVAVEAVVGREEVVRAKAAAARAVAALSAAEVSVAMDRVTAMRMCRVTVMGMDQSKTCHQMMRLLRRRPKMRHLKMRRPTMNRPKIHRATKVGSVDQSPVRWLPSGGKRLPARAPGLQPFEALFQPSLGARLRALNETSFLKRRVDLSKL